MAQMASAPPPSFQNTQNLQNLGCGGGNGDHTVPVQNTQTGDDEIQGLLQSFAKDKLTTFESEVNKLLVVSGLVITLSFAAVLQPPGGINTDPSKGDKVGSANLLLVESKAFWVFFVANGCAMAFASFAVFILVSFPARTDMQAFVIRASGTALCFVSIQCSLASFCASVWIIVGKEKGKVIPFIVGASLLNLCFFVFFIFGRAVRRVQKKLKRAKARFKARIHKVSWKVRSRRQYLPV